MLKFDLPVYLASQSPRRRKLLSILGFPFECFSVDLKEEFDLTATPEENAKRLALEKLHVSLKEIDEGIVITADTIVVLDGEIIGKPSDSAEAHKILSKLSGNTHKVYTAFAIAHTGKKIEIVSCTETEVTFAEMSEQEISNYISSGSPMDKAGAYGIQDDNGAAFIERINGCYYNVVGLPLNKLYNELKKLTCSD